MPLLFQGKILTGSLIGTMSDTQEVINFCAEMNIKPEIQLIDWEKLDEVYKVLEAGNDKVVRYVLDLDKSTQK